MLSLPPDKLAEQYYREGMYPDDNPFPKDSNEYREFDRRMSELLHDERQSDNNTPEEPDNG